MYKYYRFKHNTKWWWYILYILREMLGVRTELFVSHTLTPLMTAFNYSEAEN